MPSPATSSRPTAATASTSRATRRGPVLQGNYIGVDQTGTQPLGNAGSGISIDLSPGPPSAARRSDRGNVISANARPGISIQGSATSGAAMLGNLIGTDQSAVCSPWATGPTAWIVSGMSAVTIGGTSPGPATHLGQRRRGHRAAWPTTAATSSQGNFIGTDLQRLQPAGQRTGIARRGRLGEQHDRRHRHRRRQHHRLQRGHRRGRSLHRRGRQQIRLNSMFGDAGPGIVRGQCRGDAAITPCSRASPARAARPTSAAPSPARRAPRTLLDFYVLSSFGDRFYGEGRYLLGSSPVTTDGSGNASFSFAFPTPAQGADLHLRDGHRSERQHLGVLPRLRHRPEADGHHQLHHFDGRRGRAGPVRWHRVARSPGEPAHLYLDVRAIP